MMQRLVHPSMWLLLGSLSIAACSSNSLTGTMTSPHCGTEMYGAKKAAARMMTPGLTSSPASTDYGPDGILNLDHPLGVPPEIARIRRGMTFNFVGGFINDGLETWRGVDLDAKIVVWVDRRHFSTAAQLTRPFSDPILPDWATKTTPPSLYARKWSDDRGISEEVVSRLPLPADAAEAFVCTANSAWAAQPEIRLRPMPTDTLVSNATLLDFDAATARQYTKDVPSDGALDWVARHLSERLKYEWPLAPRP